MYDNHIVDLLLKAKNKGIHVFFKDEKLKFKLTKGKAVDAEIIELIKEKKEEILIFLSQKTKIAQDQNNASRIQKEERPSKVPLSFNQERLWFLDRLYGSVNYHIPIVLILPETIELECLNTCFLEILERHESLRTVFKEVSGEVYQEQLSVSDWSLNYRDETSLDKPLKAFINEEIHKPFDLSKDVMLRGSLVKKTDGNVLIMVLHHIASDGWSMPILVDELTTLYHSKQEGVPSNLPVLEIQYADYALWQHRQIQGEFLAKKLNYWKEQLSGLAPLNLPTDYPRPSSPSGKGAIAYYEIKKELKEGLVHLSRKEGVTMYMLLLSAFKLLLHKYSRQDDISVGSPIANRQDANLSNLIGYFVNTLVLRSDFTKINMFIELLNQVKATTLSAFTHQDVPFEKVVDVVSKDRDMSRFPLFQVVFVLQNNTDIPETSLGGAIIEEQSYEHKTAKFDLTFELTETKNELFVSVEYSTDLFDRSTIDRLFKHYKCLLASIVSNPFQSLGEISMLSTQDKQLLDTFNDTVVAYPEDETIISLFENQVKNRPDTIAVVFEGQEMSYKELDIRSNQLADYLKKQFSIQNNDLIAVKLERSEAMIVSILAVLKSGGAYVPIDPSYPEERITYIENDSECKVCIDSKLYEEFLLIKEEYSKKAISSNSQPHDLAYIIYTSGTTGQPKGVMIEHRNVVQLLSKETSLFDFDHKDVWTLFHSFCFDFSVWEIFGALLYGAKLIVVPKMTVKDPIGFFNLLVAEKVTILNQTPTAFKSLLGLEEQLDKGNLCLRYVIFGGEVLNPRQLENWYKFYPKVKLINMYGITETTVHVTYNEIDFLDLGKGFSNIGRPLPTLTVDILNEQLKAVPIGVIGEICVGGAGLARGYLNRPDLTNEKFIAHPSIQGERLYRSGDLGRRLPEGDIEYFGRKDSQIKLRGHRIELEEIAYQLQQLKEINQSVVVLKEDIKNNKRLIAYYLSDTEIDWDVMQKHLKSKLPLFMLPQVYIKLDTIPFTSNGKIDYQALPIPELFSVASKIYLPPKTKLEKILVEIWEDLLGIERVGITDNFFDIGGDSILSIQMMAKMKQIGYQIRLTDIFVYQTIADLSSNIEKMKTKLIYGEQGVLTGTSPLSPIQRRFFSFDYEEDYHFNQSLLFNMSRELKYDMFIPIIEKVINHNDSLRLRFKNEGQGWIQYYAESGNYLEKIDLSHLSEDEFLTELTQTCNYFQGQVGTNSDSLVKFIYILSPESISQNRFFVVANHLIFDGVSWRILLEQINVLVHGELRGEMPDLGLKGTSYREWVNELINFSTTEAIKKEQSYWEGIKQQYQPLPTDIVSASPSTRKDIAICSVSLSKNETSRLLLANEFYEANINSILIAALAKAIKNWSQLNQVSIGMEGHGRSDFSNTIDITETIGWFTALYPFLVKMDDNESITELIKSIKKQQDQIPNEGIGYCMHEYILNTTDNVSTTQEDCWDVVFNYLGQFDNTQDKESSKFGFSGENKGDDISKNFPIDSKFEINSYISDGLYTIELNYSIKEYYEATIISLTEDFKRLLVEITSVVSDEVVLKQNNQLDEDVLTPLNTQGDFPEIFCISGLGGSPLSLYELGKLLDKEYSLNGFVTMGLDGKSTPLDNVKDLASKYIKQLELRVDNMESCVILGYSFGGFVAYEMVQQLLKKNKKIAHLIILDIEAPHEKAFNFFQRSAPLPEKIVNSIEALLGANDFDVSIKKEELENLTEDQQFYEVYKRVEAAGLSFSEQEVLGFIKVYVANVTAAMEYEINVEDKIPVPISLIKSDKEDFEITDKQKLIFDTIDFGWSDLTTEKIDSFRVGGNHQTMLKTPHVNGIAEIIRNQLTKKQNENKIEVEEFRTL